jgi:hypothetical protein
MPHAELWTVPGQRHDADPEVLGQVAAGVPRCLTIR